MTQPYHILNGDALRERFPVDIAGIRLVARECLVDGPVQHRNEEEFFRNRARFVAGAYDGCTEEEYFSGTVEEFKRIKSIPAGSTVFLWFEDDLFCQINCWFCVHILARHVPRANVFLVRPGEHSEYGFARYDAAGLAGLLTQRAPIQEPELWSKLWEHYHRGETDKLLEQARKLATKYPFVMTAARAHVDRLPTGVDAGSPTNSLRAIVEEFGADDFGAVFREFNRREAIYGFGDVQVRRMFDRLVGAP